MTQVLQPALGVQFWEPDPHKLTERTALAERMGFAAVTVPDHPVRGLLAPLTACAIMAEASVRVKVGPLVLNNDFRHPSVLAREAAALADLSEGRFELGLGAGYATNEYRRIGIQYATGPERIDRLAESAQILRGLLAGDDVTFVGAHYRLEGDSLSDTRTRKVPILIGGNSPRLLACAAEHADIVGLVGFSPRKDGELNFSDFDLTAAERQIGEVRRFAGPRHEVAMHALVQWYEVTSNRRAAAERIAPLFERSPDAVLSSPYVLLGTHAEIERQLRELAERLTIERWTVFADRPGLDPSQLAGVLERLS
jgi:probable F420-dependent oxidoreductase